MFELIEKQGKKRLGKITTSHGDIYTPAFGPDATRGLIKNLSPNEVINLSAKTEISLDNQVRREQNEIQFLLTNTYHITTYPGDEFIQEMGGIHKFMKWPLPILTDSGGYQAFTLIHGSPHLKGKVTDDGAFFRNPLNGDKLELTPEKAIDIQFNLGSDIMVVLDDCRHYMDHKEMEKSVYRTIEWAKRCKKHFLKNLKSKLNQSWEDSYRPQLFAVVQGGIDLELRKMCAEKLVEIGFDGYSFGGWAINEKEYFPYEPLEYIADILPEDKPRYAMGVGTPENMEACINYGYDLFDCVIPSRNGRHGLAYTTEGVINIKNSQYKGDFSTLDPNLNSTASGYEKYYLHHLFKIKDALGGELLTIQNLQHFNYVMQKPFTEDN